MSRLAQLLLALVLGIVLAGFLVSLDRTADLQTQLDQERSRVDSLEQVMMEIQAGELVISTPTPPST